jgi:hypothetical protein
MLIAASQVGKKIQENGDVSAGSSGCTRKNHH